VEFPFPTGHVSCATQKRAKAATESAFEFAQEGTGVKRPQDSRNAPMPAFSIPIPPAVPQVRLSANREWLLGGLRLGSMRSMAERPSTSVAYRPPAPEVILAWLEGPGTACAGQEIAASGGNRVIQSDRTRSTVETGDLGACPTGS